MRRGRYCTNDTASRRLKAHFSMPTPVPTPRQYSRGAQMAALLVNFRESSSHRYGCSAGRMSSETEALGATDHCFDDLTEEWL